MDSQTKDAISSFIVILTSASISNNILDGLLSGMGVWHLLVICFSIILYLNNQQYSRFTNLCTAFGAFVGLRLTAITVVDGWYSGNQTTFAVWHRTPTATARSLHLRRATASIAWWPFHGSAPTRPWPLRRAPQAAPTPASSSCRGIC